MFDVLFEKILLLDPEDGEKKDMYLGVRDGKIAYISAEKPEEGAARTIGGKDRLLIPGLKNTHTHIAMTALRGVSDDENLNNWLFGSVIPVESRMTGEMKDASAKLGLLEAAASGTTAICNMYSRAPQLAEAMQEMGMRGNVGNPPLAMEDISGDPGSVRETMELVERFSGDALITPVLGVHSVHTTCPSVWKWVTQTAEKYALPLVMHMAEAKQDVETCFSRFGDSPAAVLEANGLFARRALIAHGIWVDERDLEILRRNGVTLSHCPISNLKLSSGIAPILSYLERGMRVTLGTDGVASNNNLDLFEEMKYAVLLQKYKTGDASSLTAADVFRFATVNAAKALGYDRCGLLKEGYDADLCVLSLDRPGLMPVRSALSNLVYSACGRDVCLTMVRGRIVYEDGVFPTVDQEKITAEFRRIMAQL